MKRFIRWSVVAIGLLVLAAGSGVGWYAFATPPIENLPLGPELVSVASPEGQRLLASSQSKTDLSQLAPHLVGQVRRAFCGPATTAAVLNAALHPQPSVTQTSLFTSEASAVKGELALTFAGLTLDELTSFLRAHKLRVQPFRANDTGLAEFRDAARTTLAEPNAFLVVNYDRRILGQEGGGHISPLGAYDAATDRVLVLDVATQKYPYTWVPTAKLWAAMNTTDSASGQRRGYLLVSAR